MGPFEEEECCGARDGGGNGGDDDDDSCDSDGDDGGVIMVVVMVATASETAKRYPVSINNSLQLRYCSNPTGTIAVLQHPNRNNGGTTP